MRQSDLEAQSAVDSDSSENETSTILEIPLKRRRARLSLAAQAHQMLIRKRTRRWHATLAGAVAGGLGVMFEIRSRRTVIGQQMFVRFVRFVHMTGQRNISCHLPRGLQGSWNAFTTKRNIRIFHGDIIVFSLAYVDLDLFASYTLRKYCRCAQIMYGFLLRPDTLPRSYNTWCAPTPLFSFCHAHQLLYVG